MVDLIVAYVYSTIRFYGQNNVILISELRKEVVETSNIEPNFEYLIDTKSMVKLSIGFT
jgi:hypothetical protein